MRFISIFSFSDEDLQAKIEVDSAGRLRTAHTLRRTLVITDQSLLERHAGDLLMQLQTISPVRGLVAQKVASLQTDISLIIPSQSSFPLQVQVVGRQTMIGVFVGGF